MRIERERPLILGSSSPRRKSILEDLRIAFRINPSHVDENVAPGEAPQAFIERVTHDKLLGVARRADLGSFAGILVADTIVVIDGEILNKPLDTKDAVVLLSRLVGRTHSVFTRYVVSKADRPEHAVVTRTVESLVTMRAATRPEVERYAASGEGLDKAGAYAAQGLGAFLVERIAGSYTNVIGLPASELVCDLLELGMLVDYP
jgi:septum formation protein